MCRIGFTRSRASFTAATKPKNSVELLASTLIDWKSYSRLLDPPPRFEPNKRRLCLHHSAQDGDRPGERCITFNENFVPTTFDFKSLANPG